MIDHAAVTFSWSGASINPRKLTKSSPQDQTITKASLKFFNTSLTEISFSEDLKISQCNNLSMCWIALDYNFRRALQNFGSILSLSDIPQIEHLS